MEDSSSLISPHLHPSTLTLAMCAFCHHDPHIISTKHTGSPSHTDWSSCRSCLNRYLSFANLSLQLHRRLMSACFILICDFLLSHFCSFHWKKKKNLWKCDTQPLKNWKPMAWCYVKNSVLFLNLFFKRKNPTGHWAKQLGMHRLHSSSMQGLLLLP